MVEWRESIMWQIDRQEDKDSGGEECAEECC